ncbi:MAG: peptidase [Novosphingobium sp. 12-64-8]|nr:MAG: peptidase [Novosphingobium sp. 12-64-8]
MTLRRAGGFAASVALAACAVAAPAQSPAPAEAAPTTALSGLPATGLSVRGPATQGGWLRGRVAPGTRALSLDGQPVPFAADGGFFVAFDRDAGPQATLAVTLESGVSLSTPIAIAPRGWAIEHINAAKRPGGMPDAEYQRRRAGELAQIKAARALDTEAQGWRQAFARPAAGRFSGKFGSQRIYRGEPGAYHSGLDIAGGAGTPFSAPADGVVVLAAQDPFTLEGHLLIIDHGMGLSSAFLHASALKVKQGDVVRQGQVVGLIGSTGRATGPHLHWGVVWKGRRLDPLLFLAPAG